MHKHTIPLLLLLTLLIAGCQPAATPSLPTATPAPDLPTAAVATAPAPASTQASDPNPHPARP